MGDDNNSIGDFDYNNSSTITQLNSILVPNNDHHLVPDHSFTII